jgi:energy-coupling factor transporter ATP-binding protein EcfA2
LYGKHEIDLSNSGKNLMLYGENGSGKSSVTKAIRLFFQSAADEIDISDYENIFVQPPNKNTSYIKLTIGESRNTRSNHPYILDNSNNRQTDPFIAKANKIKGFLDYKTLLKTHYLDTEKVNIFSLLVENLLSDFVNPQTANKIETEWNKIKRDVIDKRTNQYKELISEDGLLKKFNIGLKELLAEVEIQANKLMQYFDKKLVIKLHFNYLTIGREKGFVNETIELKVDFCNKMDLPKHHLFLNEARLTAISIAIYLGAILSNIQEGYRLLVLDDVLIGLDTSNRLPFLRILEEKFGDYQIF